MLNVKVISDIFGSDKSSEKVPDIQLKLVSEQVSLKEIITRSVTQQVKEMEGNSLTKEQIKKRLNDQYLNKEDVEQLAIDGKVSYSSATGTSGIPKVEAEEIRAINAFKRNKFKVFIDGEEITSLGEIRPLYEGCVIKFIRLIPLVGG
jgi:hypothetical protein